MAHALPPSPSREDDSPEPSDAEWNDSLPSDPLDILDELADLVFRLTDSHSEDIIFQIETLIYTVERIRALVHLLLEFVTSKLSEAVPPHELH